MWKQWDKNYIPIDRKLLDKLRDAFSGTDEAGRKQRVERMRKERGNGSTTTDPNSG